MFRRIFLPFLLLLTCVAECRAYELKALTVDTVGEPLSFVTYRIYGTDTVKPLVSNTSDVNGAINQTLNAAGKYRVVLSYVGMADRSQDFEVSAAKPVADLGKIKMKESEQVLDAVTVTAQKPLVVKQIDRLGYDVQADPETPTSNLSEILRKVPMISVDPDGTIKVNGSTDFKIYKNGRPNNSMSRNAKELFQAMPASMIKRVEVITDPGARFDAEGTSAILNIVTDDNVSIKGIMGNARVSYTSGDDAPDASLFLTTEINKVTFSAYGGYSYFGGRNYRGRSHNETYFPDGTRRESDSNSDTKGNFGYFGFEGSYQLDTLNLFTVELNGYSHSGDPRSNLVIKSYDAEGSLIGSISNRSLKNSNSYTDIDAAFNYQHNTHRKGEIYTFSYLLSHTSQNNDGHTLYEDGFGVDAVPYSEIISKYKLNFIEHTFQADWTRTFGKHNLDFGAKAIFRRNHSDNNYIYKDWRETDNEFTHQTNIGAIYGQYSYNIGPVGLRAGLRWEYSHLKASYPDGKGEDYSSRLSDWVPSAAASWQINDANSLTFNYSTSISRPGISYLNPAVSQSPGYISYGNADLESSRRSSMKLTYMLIKQKFNFNFTTTYAFVNNGISRISFLDQADDNTIVNTYGNVGHTRELGFNAFMQWSPSSKTRLMLNGGVRYNRAKQEGYEQSRWCPQGYMKVSQQLPFKIWSELSVYCFGSWMNGVYGYSNMSFADMLNYNIGFRRSFLKDDRLNVSLTIANPIGPGTRTYRNYTVNGQYTGRSDSYSLYCHKFMVSVSYRFGSLNTQVKKTARSIENDDLVGRK